MELNGVNTRLLKPPKAKMIPHTFTIHNDVRVDYYYWLRDKNDPDTIKYIKDENRYADDQMEDTKPLQHRLYHEMVGRMTEDELSVHEKIDDFYYYKRKVRGKQYPIYCRKKAKFQAKEEILLDLNLLEPYSPYLRLGVYKISPDHKKLAYSIDLTGGESFQLYIKDLNNGIVLPESIQQTSYWVEWGEDNNSLYYTTLDHAKRSNKLFKHIAGNSPSLDLPLYEESNTAFSIQLQKTKDRRYFMLYLRSNTTSEVRFRQSDSESNDFQILYPRMPGIHYAIEHNNGKFYILTNQGGLNYRITSVDTKFPAYEHWKDIIPHRENSRIESMEMFRDYLVAHEREDGMKRILVYNLLTNRTSNVHFADKVYDYRPGRNFNFNTNILRFHYSSFKTPPSIFDYQMDKHRRILRKQKKVKNFTPARYLADSLTVKSVDGTEIKMSLVYLKGMVKDSRNPVLLYGYGAYGVTEEAAFDSRILSLIDRGFIYVIAHVRGGGKKGTVWHQNGSLLNKKNSFSDFITCAEHLIQEKYTSPEYLSIMGESAGGLLIGAATNLRPSLFKAVVAKVPFMDVLNTMLDPTLPLTVPEFEEWGNPQVEEYYRAIRAYSPYDNIEVKEYPHMLLTAGLNDSRVGYWEVAKFAAKLRTFKTGQNLLILKTDMHSGHDGQSGRYNRLKETAFIFAFILKVLGINKGKLKGKERKVK